MGNGMPAPALNAGNRALRRQGLTAPLPWGRLAWVRRASYLKPLAAPRARLRRANPKG